METVVERGWVHNIRRTKRFLFVILRNRGGLTQLTFKKEANPELFERADELGLEDVIEVKGALVEKAISKLGREIIPLELKVLSKARHPLPLDVKGDIPAQLPVRLDWRPLDLRRKENRLVFEVQASIIEAAESFLREKGFLQVFTPCIIGGISEGGAEVFRIDYFGREAFLRQDPQLHRQLLMVAGFEKIFEVGPSWRAEKSHTRRHLCEHRGIAVEMSFIRDEYDVMRLEEELVCFIMDFVIRKHKDELEELGVELERPRRPFPVLEFPEIYDILRGMGKQVPYGGDYDRESEVLLWRYVRENYDNDFFFVNRFPFAVKPFYVMRVDEEPVWARSTDLIYKGVELSSGGQREHRYERIVEQIKLKNMDPAHLEWFTRHFMYGAPPHGGFNIGLERLTMQILGLKNIREAVLFARDVERLNP